jgi:hypothetical protein
MNIIQIKVIYNKVFLSRHLLSQNIYHRNLLKYMKVRRYFILLGALFHYIAQLDERKTMYLHMFFQH